MDIETRSEGAGATAEHVFEGLLAEYSPEEEMPLGGYAALMGAYALVFGGFLAVVHRRLPTRIAARDVVLLGVATHKLARIVTKDWVTIPMRAPFTKYERSTGGGEVQESSRGRGLRRAIGDLLTCPFCIGPWIAGALAIGLVTRPKVTRFVATIFGAVAISDALHHAYTAEKRLSQ
jgi:hypothetical protein